jgi:isoleucyl-tRNA synthetase
MYHIVEALVRWLMPILSFTAEDIWQHIPGARGDSILLEQWYDVPGKEDEAMGLSFWQQAIGVREAVSKELETLRATGGIGSSLAAEVDLYCPPALYADLKKLGDELRFVLITSYARVHPEAEAPADAVTVTMTAGQAIKIKVQASAHTKCIRCWHHRDDVGANDEHPELCGRCVDNVSAAGEQRLFA